MEAGLAEQPSEHYKGLTGARYREDIHGGTPRDDTRAGAQNEDNNGHAAVEGRAARVPHDVRRR